MRRLLAREGFKGAWISPPLLDLPPGWRPPLQSLNPGYTGQPTQGRFHRSISQVPSSCFAAVVLPDWDAAGGAGGGRTGVTGGPRSLLFALPRRHIEMDAQETLVQLVCYCWMSVKWIFFPLTLRDEQPPLIPHFSGVTSSFWAGI